jgi:hypothetical protein
MKHSVLPGSDWIYRPLWRKTKLSGTKDTVSNKFFLTYLDVFQYAIKVSQKFIYDSGN